MQGIMQKKAILTIISFVICVALSACELPGFMYDISEQIDGKVDDFGNMLNGEEPEEFTYTDPEPYTAPKIDIDPEVSEEVIDIGDEAGDDEGSSGDIKVNVEDDAALVQKLSEERYYAYGTLTQEERRLYRVIYTTLFDFAEKVPLDTLDADLVDRVFDCVLADNPELFYVKGYNLTRYTRGGTVVGMAISGMNTMTKGDSLVHQEKADAYVRTCLDGAPQTDDDYEKIKYLYEYIIRNTEYDINAQDDQNYLSVFENGRSVCQGYAKAMQYMMLRMGLFCTFVRGVTNKGESHAWNLVRSNGDYYYVDVTWGDASYDITAMGDMADLPVMPEVSYEYLCVPTDDIKLTHTLNSSFPLPECTVRYDNYFVRNGNYFTEVSDEMLTEVFNRAYDNGESAVTVKCSDTMVYAQMRRYLIDDNSIFSFLRGRKNVEYSSIDKLNELIFYI